MVKPKHLNPDREAARKLVAEAAQKRADNWQPVPVRALPEVDRLMEPAMLGAHSFALLETRRRLIRDRIMIDGATGIFETPSAIARDYLRARYERGPIGTRDQLAEVSVIPPVPSYARPMSFFNGFYIDIRSCYWSIMNVIGWNVDYNPGLWLSPGRAPADFPFPDHKVSRNCLASAGRLGGIPMYNPRRLPGNPYTEVVRGNSLQNNMLPRLISDILNSIADQAIKAGAVYVNNDGMIAPSGSVRDRVERIIADWGLFTSVKAHGGGVIKASGTYAIGNTRTLNYHQVRGPHPIAAVYPPEHAKWLQREFSKFAQGAEIPGVTED